MIKNIFFVLLLFVLAGCIEDYEAKTRGIDNILVVEGMITSGTTQITLSKSVRLDEWLMWGETNFVENALVYVECNDGSKSEAVSFSVIEGKYLIETGELNINAKYRLVIQLDGEVYHSSYIAPAISPPVELSYRINYNINKGDTIGINYTDVLVSTQGQENQPGYYLWSYMEDWELSSYIGWDKCWKSENSRSLILGTSERLSVNVIKEKKIHNINSWDDRLSELYRIRVKQYVIHQEGYDYFENLNRGTHQIGDIFGPIPSELMGNIRCVSNPRIMVIGYVDVSTITTDELYLTSKCFDGKYRAQRAKECSEQLQQPPYIASEWCTDCTNQGGTRKKPLDWPR